MASLVYVSGLRLMECVRLRVTVLPPRSSSPFGDSWSAPVPRTSPTCGVAIRSPKSSGVKLMALITYLKGGSRVTQLPPSTKLAGQVPYWPKRWRYSPEEMNALTISAWAKFPPNWFSLFNQKL